MFSMELKGLKDLQKQLLDLGDHIALKTLARAARDAFMPVIDQARSMAPVDRGVLRDSIKISIKRPTKGDAVVVVGLRFGKVKMTVGDVQLNTKQTRALKATKAGRALLEEQPGRRWHWAEFGTSHSAARPFIRPAWDANVGPMVERLKTAIAEEIRVSLSRKR